MEFRHLRYFVAVAEELNFTKAAEKLFLAQPSLTRQIRDLEEELGVLMFDRSKNRISLTPEGETFLIDARRLLAESARSVLAVQRLSRGETEELKIGYMASLYHDVIPITLKAFRKVYPGTLLMLFNMSPAEQYLALGEHRIDLGFLSLQCTPHDNDLERACLARDLVIVVLPEGCPIARKPTIRLKELESMPFISLSETAYPGLRRWLVDTCQKAGFFPNIQQEVECEPAVLNLVAAGAGVALLPRPVERLPHNGVVFRRLNPAAASEFYVTWHSESKSQALKNFIGVLQNMAETVTEAS
jgi:DNA-binding transcriptional LysR family regulator